MTPYELAKTQIDLVHRTKKQSIKFRKFKLKELPPELCDLIHLRSIELENLELESLPSDIGRLVELINFTASRLSRP